MVLKGPGKGQGRGLTAFVQKVFEGIYKVIQFGFKKILPISLVLVAIGGFFLYEKFQESRKLAVQQEAVLQAKKTFDLYRISAEQGIADAQYNFGGMYYGGVGVKQDVVEAHKWFLKAAQQGHRNGQKNVASLYESGVGVAKNEAKAFKWYLKAANQKDAASQMAVGRFYSAGKGVTQDIKAAYMWFTISQKNGESQAATFRDKLTGLTSAQIAEANKMADEWIKNKH